LEAGQYLYRAKNGILFSAERFVTAVPIMFSYEFPKLRLQFSKVIHKSAAQLLPVSRILPDAKGQQRVTDAKRRTLQIFCPPWPLLQKLQCVEKGFLALTPFAAKDAFRSWWTEPRLAFAPKKAVAVGLAQTLLSRQVLNGLVDQILAEDGDTDAARRPAFVLDAFGDPEVPCAKAFAGQKRVPGVRRHHAFPQERVNGVALRTIQIRAHKALPGSKALLERALGEPVRPTFKFGSRVDYRHGAPHREFGGTSLRCGEGSSGNEALRLFPNS